MSNDYIEEQYDILNNAIENITSAIYNLEDNDNEYDTQITQLMDIRHELKQILDNEIEPEMQKIWDAELAELNQYYYSTRL